MKDFKVDFRDGRERPGGMPNDPRPMTTHAPVTTTTTTTHGPATRWTENSLVEAFRFAAICPVFALSFQLSLFFGKEALRLDKRTRLSPGFEWARFMSKTVMRSRLKLAPGSSTICRDRRTVYLSNHRAWSDFFLDMYATEGKAFTMSRMLVAYAFPLFMVPAMYCGAVFGFKRDSGDKEKLNSSLDAHFETFGDYNGIVIYPEGTRNVREHSLPLKRGMLRYAHSRKLAVQVMMTARKEKVFSSHLVCANRNVALPIHFGEVIRAEDYPDFEDFYNEIRARWDDGWCAVNAVSEAEAEKLLDYVPQERPVRSDTRNDIATIGGVLVTVFAVALTYRVLTRAYE